MMQYYLLHRQMPGLGEGYDLQMDQDFWHDDGSAEFSTLWEKTAGGPVLE